MDRFNRIFSSFANTVSRWSGRPAAFFLGLALVLGWAVCGPFFHFSDTWQLIINTSTTIVTFLMVLVIQNTQNRDNAGIQAKLDELIRATDSRNHFIGIERQSEGVIGQVREEVERHADDAVKGLKTAERAEKEAIAKAKIARAKARAARVRANQAKLKA